MSGDSSACKITIAEIREISDGEGRNMGALAVVGGDLRQRFLCAELKRRGYTVRTFGLGEDSFTLSDTVRAADTAVILPVPVTRDGKNVQTPLSSNYECSLSDLLAVLPEGVCLLGGMIPEAWKKAFCAHGIRVTDYFQDEVFQLKNALPTAEGAIRLAMEALPVTLFGTRVAVVGYGRIGALLTKKLVSLGAKVTALARSAIACANGELQGADGALIENGKILFPTDCRAVFNTVPCRVIGAEDLRALSSNCVLIELASAPSGFDAKEATDAGLRVISAPGLPGRFYPESAGLILAETVCAILGVND